LAKKGKAGGRGWGGNGPRKVGKEQASASRNFITAQLATRRAGQGKAQSDDRSCESNVEKLKTWKGGGKERAGSKGVVSALGGRKPGGRASERTKISHGRRISNISESLAVLTVRGGAGRRRQLVPFGEFNKKTSENREDKAGAKIGAGNQNARIGLLNPTAPTVNKLPSERKKKRRGRQDSGRNKKRRCWAPKDQRALKT